MKTTVVVVAADTTEHEKKMLYYLWSLNHGRINLSFFIWTLCK